MKKTSLIALIALTAIGFSSCMKQENYPDYPVLSDATLVANSDGTATLQVNFTDGNGAIGYQSGDASTPNFYMKMLQDSSNNWLFRLEPGLNNDLLGDTVGFIYNVPYLTPTGKDKELSGQIQVQMPAGQLTGWWLNKNTNYKYVVWLIDRNGNISNKLTTNSIISPN